MPATISLARGWPAPECLPVAELADCARSALERDGTHDPLVRAFQRLRAAAGMGCRAARRRPVARVPDERLAAGTRVPRAAARARTARARRAAHVRPAAEDPLARSAPRSSRSTATTRASIPMRSRRRSRTASRRRSCTCCRPSRTRAAARCPRIAAAVSSSWPPTHDLLVLEDDPYGLVRFDGEPLPSLHELSGGDDRVQLVVLEDDRRPGCGSAGSCFPETLARELEATATGDLHHARAARPGDGVRVPAARSVRAEPRAGPRPARRAPRRDARRVRA